MIQSYRVKNTMTLEIKENELLAGYSTFAIGGPSKYLVVVKNKEEVLEAIAFSQSKKIPFFILGGGSNVLFDDIGYNGLIIKIQLGELKNNGDGVITGSGVWLGQLINASLSFNLTGLEWAIGIPGTVGGAIQGNAGAYGRSVSEFVKEVTVLVEEGGVWEVKKYTDRDCRFDYRKSRFKSQQNREIILEVDWRLQKGDPSKGREEMKNILAQRKNKAVPYPSAGCVFKNIKKDGRLVAAVGQLVEECGLKGTRIGDAAIPLEHGNYVVNMGRAKSGEVKKLIQLCRDKVQEKFGYLLEEEIILM